MIQPYPTRGEPASPPHGDSPMPHAVVAPTAAALVSTHDGVHCHEGTNRSLTEKPLKDGTSKDLVLIDTSLQDEDLVALAQKGSQPAMEVLCQRYAPLIHKYANQSQMASERSDTESHLWYLFIKAIRDFHLEGPVPFAGYAKSVIRYGQSNLFQQLRRLWRRELVMTDGDDEDGNAEHSQRTTLEAWPAKEQTEEDVLHQWELDTLRVAFQELMPQQQELLYAVFYDHRSIADLAREHGISRQAMHKHYQRALTSLRVYYEGITKEQENLSCHN